MKFKIITRILAAFAAVLIITAAACTSWAESREKLCYSCSNQIYEAVDKEKIKAFTEAAGIEVEAKAGASIWAVMQLMHSYSYASDLASSARALYKRHKNSGLEEIPFCKDPIVVIAREGCGVESLTEKQVQDIFSQKITNWKEVGGENLEITVIVPCDKTAASKNFQGLIMKEQNISYDIMVWDSTMASKTVNFFPCGAVSFIGHGAIAKDPKIRTIKIDGRSPDHPEYPYYQTFYYVTKGEPKGAAKKFIDFTYSETGRKLLKESGLVPINK